MTKRPSWDEYFLKMCDLVATRAACTRRQVGAVLVSASHRIVSCGYNGTPAGETNCTEGGCPRGRLTYAELPQTALYDGSTPCSGMHAEHQAILFAGLDKATGATLYCSQEPCSQCWVLIKASGVLRVIWPEGGWE